MFFGDDHTVNHVVLWIAKHSFFIDWKNTGTKKIAVKWSPKHPWLKSPKRLHFINWIHLNMTRVNVQQVKHYVRSCHKAEEGGGEGGGAGSNRSQSHNTRKASSSRSFRSHRCQCRLLLFQARLVSPSPPWAHGPTRNKPPGGGQEVQNTSRSTQQNS